MLRLTFKMLASVLFLLPLASGTKSRNWELHGYEFFLQQRQISSGRLRFLQHKCSKRRTPEGQGASNSTTDSTGSSTRNDPSKTRSNTLNGTKVYE